MRLIRLGEAALADDAAFAPVFAAFRAKSMDALDQVPGLVVRNPTLVSIAIEGDAVVGVLHRATQGAGGVDFVPDPASRLALPKGLG